MVLADTINEITQRFVSVLNTPGAAGAGEFYDDDADLLPPGPDNVKGRAAIQSFWAAATEHLGEAELTAVDIAEIAPGCAREIGTYRARVKQTGEAVSGKYVVIWRKIDGEWKIWTDIWTSHQGQT
jgi:ketosteroid isomerase-like protein